MSKKIDIQLIAKNVEKGIYESISEIHDEVMFKQTLDIAIRTAILAILEYHVQISDIQE